MLQKQAASLNRRAAGGCGKEKTPSGFPEGVVGSKSD
jgi:hypothetical protein